MFKFGVGGLIRNSQFVIRNECNILPLAKCKHMVGQERSVHHGKIPIGGHRISSVQFVPDTIRSAFALAKGFLNYELRITNYEFGRRPLNCNSNGGCPRSPIYTTRRGQMCRVFPRFLIDYSTQFEKMQDFDVKLAKKRRFLLTNRGFCAIIPPSFPVMPSGSSETVGGGALENPLNGCRRCKVGRKACRISQAKGQSRQMVYIVSAS